MGVTVETISAGDGKTFPKKGDKVTMHYVGTLAKDGSKFDSSRDRGSPFVTNIGVGQVIKGWDEGVPQLSIGQKANLHITADYGYGSRGAGSVIPPNADLKFEVELLKINASTPFPMSLFSDFGDNIGVWLFILIGGWWISNWYSNSNDAATAA